MKKILSLILSSAVVAGSAVMMTTAASAAKNPALKLSNETSGVKLSWSKTGARSFTVQRRTAGKQFRTVKKLSGKFSYTDKNAKSGTKYAYRVLCDGQPSDSKKIVRLDTPKIKYMWSDSFGLTIECAKVKGAKSYEFYKAEVKNGKVGKYKKFSESKNKQLFGFGEISGKTFKYKARAVSGSYKSAFSKEKKYSHIQLFTVEPRINKRFDGVTLIWDTLYGASSYDLYKSVDNKNFTKIATEKETAKSYPEIAVYHKFDDTDVVDGETYYYYLSAKLESGYTKSMDVEDITFRCYDKEMTLKAGDVDGKTLDRTDDDEFGRFIEVESSDNSIAVIEKNSDRQYTIKALEPGVTYIYYSYVDDTDYDYAWRHRIKLTVEK